MREELMHRIELTVQIDRLDAAAGSDANVAFDGHHERRPVIALRDASGGESEDAAMPAFAGEDEDSFAAFDLGLRGFADLDLDLLAFDIYPIELGADFPRCVFIARREEIDGGIRRCKPAGGVDARTDLEADVDGA